jgi:hypothetical protein
MEALRGQAHQWLLPQNFKSRGVLSLKQMNNQWNETGVIFSNAYESRRAGFMVGDAESARSGPPWTVSPWFFYSMLYMLVNFVTKT